MSSRLTMILGPILSIFGCVNTNGPIKAPAGKLTQAQVDKIVKGCGGQIGKAVIRRGEVFIYDISADARLTVCIVDGLRETGEVALPEVGSQAYVANGNDTSRGDR